MAAKFGLKPLTQKNWRQHGQLPKLKKTLSKRENGRATEASASKAHHPIPQYVTVSPQTVDCGCGFESQLGQFSIISVKS